MKQHEKEAIETAERNLAPPQLTASSRIKKLGEELAEFAEAVGSGDKTKIINEGSDVSLTLLLTLKACGVFSEITDLGEMALVSAKGFEARTKAGYYGEPKTIAGGICRIKVKSSGSYEMEVDDEIIYFEGRSSAQYFEKFYTEKGYLIKTNY